MNASEKKRPIASKRVGRFEIALFRFERRRLDGNDTEQVSMTDRVCVSYSRYLPSVRRYETAKIWCYADELRDLVAVLDECNDDFPEIHPRAPTREEEISSSGR